jgi:hypothetical protein
MSDHVRRNPGRPAGAILLILAASTGWAAAAPVTLLPPVVGASELYCLDARTGLALRGFDPVTYHLPGGPRGGRPEFEILWRGVAWRFETEANRQAFLSASEAFAPRVGGRDAASAARGIAADADPEIYAVVDQRLYLFRTEANREAFVADPSLRVRAEQAWRALAGTLVQP